MNSGQRRLKSGACHSIAASHGIIRCKSICTTPALIPPRFRKKNFLTTVKLDFVQNRL